MRAPKGNRPSFIKAAHPDLAIPLYKKFVNECASTVTTKTGVFGANMKVALVNDGPVTIWLDSKNRSRITLRLSYQLPTVACCVWYPYR